MKEGKIEKVEGGEMRDEITNLLHETDQIRGEAEQIMTENDVIREVDRQVGDTRLPVNSSPKKRVVPNKRSKKLTPLNVMNLYNEGCHSRIRSEPSFLRIHGFFPHR